MENIEQIQKDGQKLLRFGKQKADHVLINISRTLLENVEIKNNHLGGMAYSDSCVYVVNLWKDGKMGMSSGSKFSLDLVDKALKIAKASKKLEYFYGLPDKDQIIHPDNFDKKIISLDEEQLISMAKDLVLKVKTPKLTLSNGGFEKDHNFCVTLNSNGVDVSEESTSFSVSMSITGRENGKVSNTWPWKNECFMFDYDELVAEGKQQALDALRAKTLKANVKNVILVPEPLSELLTYAFLPNLNAKSVEKKQSCLVGKLGEQIWDKNFCLNDNGILNRGISSSSVDFEGSAHSDITLIKNGVLNGFIYDHNTAKHAGVKNSGNASSSGIGFTNVILNGKYNKIDEGLIVNCSIGAHTSNPITTDFSIRGDNCYYYKNGEKIPVKGVMLSGRMMEVLSNIASIDKKKEQRGGIYTGSLVSDKINVIRH